jgi:hypothetical protein
MMSPELVDEIRTSDCWDGPVTDCVQLTILRDRGEDGPLAAPGLLLVTRSMFYIMEQVAGDDAAIIHEDLIDAVEGCDLVVPDDADLAATGDQWAVDDDAAPQAATLTLVDGIEVVVESVPTDTGAMSFTLESLRALFPSVPKPTAAQSRPATPPAPPEPSLQLTLTSPLPVAPAVEASAVLSRSSYEPARLDSTSRGLSEAQHDGGVDASAIQLEAERLQSELEAERGRLQGMLETTAHSHELEAVDLGEDACRGAILVAELTDVVSLFGEFTAEWRTRQAAESDRLLADVKQLHCSTHKLESVLPDGVSGLNEVPLNSDVQELLERTEKAARANLDAYLTTEQLQSRERRKKLEVEMATRDVRVELAAQTRTIAQLRADLSALRARCSDLDASIRAKTNEATELRNREQAVIDRARKREEELYAQLERLTSSGGGARRGGNAAPAFDFIQS